MSKNKQHEKVVKSITKYLRSILSNDYTVIADKDRANLLYSIQLLPDKNKEQLKIHPDIASIKKPKRGQNAFQVDILIKKSDIPLVIIEVKSPRITSHEVITYNSKSLKHKSIYPYLRYGMLIYNTSAIPDRVIKHGINLDFIIVLENPLSQSQEALKEVIKEQIKSAESLINALLQDIKCLYTRVNYID